MGDWRSAVRKIRMMSEPLLTEAGKSPGQDSEHHDTNKNGTNNDKPESFTAREAAFLQCDRTHAE